ncbi:MAG: N-acetylmuramoyl-L-alanine amidase [Oscillospiraceae bacterium]|nr:N-acetylmuramoyl-L-alanine amidase [Oscillospiraceae bacterium]
MESKMNMLKKIALMCITIIIVAFIGSYNSYAASGELAGRVIILDPGHGERSTNVFEGYNEHVAMLSLAHRIKPLLEAHGAKVYMTRATAQDVSLPARTAMINILGLSAVRDAHLRDAPNSEHTAREVAQIDRLIGVMQSIIDNPREQGEIYKNTPFDPLTSIHPDMRSVLEIQNHPEIAGRFLTISLHSNATARPINTEIHGADVFFISNDHRNTRNYFTGFGFSEQSRQFGEILISNIDSVGIQRRAVQRANFFILREINMPAVLVENGFHTNPRDRANLQNDDFLNRLAVAYLDAIKTYFSGISLDGNITDAINRPISTSTSEPVFSDVPRGTWYFDAVLHASNQGIFAGTAPQVFSPNTGMTRAMFATVLSRHANVNFWAYNETPFTDVIQGRWYGHSVSWAYTNGIISFVQGNQFYPQQYITREEIAMMLYNLFRLTDTALPMGDYGTFADHENISIWAYPGVQAMRDMDVMRGDARNNFNPQNRATRAEVAQIFLNIAELDDYNEKH